MKLLMISTDRKMFEAGSAVRARMAEYARAYEELHIIVFAGREFSEQVISPNCWVYPTRSISKLLYPFGAISLGSFIAKRRKITNITCQDPFLTAMAGVSLKNRFNIPLEIQIHTDIGSPYFSKSLGNKLKKYLALSYLAKADHVRVVSSRIRDYLIQTGIVKDVSKIEVRPIKVDVERIKNQPVTVDLHKKYPQFEKIILMASRLEKEKDIGLAIQAFREVLKKMPKTGLIIVGEGSQTFGRRDIPESGGETSRNSIIFEKWADFETLVSYYKTADLFLVTSQFEGYGMTLVEAQAAGCPIVSTDVGVAREVGAMIADHSVEDIAEKVIQSLVDSRRHPSSNDRF